MFHRPRDEAQEAGKTDAQENGQRPVGTMMPPPPAGAHAARTNTQNQTTSHNTKEKERQTMSPYQNEDKNDQGNERTEAPVGMQQRTAHTPPGASRIPGSYASSYPGYGSSSHGNANSETLSRGRKLIVGDGISMSGEIDACDHLIVEGKVEAALKGASLLDIAETGVFYGTVEIEEATIAGRFEGDLTVNGRLTIKSTGSITGAISYKELAVEAGAVVDGKISPLREGGTRRAEPKGSKSSEAPRSRKEQAHEEGGLPFEKTAEAAE